MRIKLLSLSINRRQLRRKLTTRTVPPASAKYGVRLGADIHWTTNLHDAIVYLGVATDWAGDLIQVRGSYSAEPVTLTAIGDVPVPKPANGKSLVAPDWHKLESVINHALHNRRVARTWSLP